MNGERGTRDEPLSFLHIPQNGKSTKSKCDNIIAIKNMEKKYSSKNYQLSGFFG